jgi:hypothetical protein
MPSAECRPPTRRPAVSPVGAAVLGARRLFHVTPALRHDDAVELTGKLVQGGAAPSRPSSVSGKGVAMRVLLRLSPLMVAM